jgi:formylglycine-generating enzyme required for sulfatase activity/dienelactone hydrolase
LDSIASLQHPLLGRYLIEREIGRGGMSIVYVARDLKLERLVALKTLRPELVPAFGTQRFLREIQIASRLQHPNILPLQDWGDIDGLLYYVMPFVNGESLRGRLLREGQLPLKDVMHIARQVTDALAYAHSHDVVHRDIKPENLLLEEQHVLVCDFGIARAITAATGERLTETGLALGTAAYMSPEQAAADRRIDGRSDIYSLGCVLYEMLSGEPPFTGSSVQAVIARKLTDPVLPVRTVRETVPPRLEEMVLTCMARAPADRYSSAEQLSATLQSLEPEITAGVAGPSRPAHHVRRGFPSWSWFLLGAVLGLGALAVHLWRVQSRSRWARNVALPEAIRLNGQGKPYQAFRLLRRAQSLTPGDAIIKDYFVEWTGPLDIVTTPPGAQVYVRDFFDPPASADSLGPSPLKGLRLPLGRLVWRVSAPGFQTTDVLGWTRTGTLEFSLARAADARPGMVPIGGGPVPLNWGHPVEVQDYWIDKYEVTNREFMAFVNAGGYNRQEYWKQPFRDAGRPISWEEARNSFHDRTGRLGPATWESGAYPDGQENYPVSGVSWYEAAAYCEYKDKKLPTVYHWYNAADLGSVTEFARFGNFEAGGPAEVGNPLRLGGNGTYDMAGNVKEWAWNEATSDRRYLLGGGWNEASYQFRDYDAQRALDRQPTYGFRCTSYRTPPSAALTGRVIPRWRDYRRETPANDEVFAIYKGFYQYTKTPLEARVDPAVQQFGHWSVERVSFAAAYEDKRVPALLYIPRNSVPPFQTIVYFPGASAFRQTSEAMNALEVQGDWFLFLVRSGRAVIVPFYQSFGGRLDLPNVWRDIVIHASKDIGRTIDYIETRPDLDSSRIGYLGLSMGAGVAPIMIALEPRFKTSALISGGFYLWREPPESEPFNFAPRVKIPTLMVNGRYDFFFPYEASQAPMFQLLGSVPGQKKHRVFDSGHVPNERDAAMREILDWFDRYLGPVRPEVARVHR